jgi:2-polyprenyl-6-methoxyphenol hydroxylase-like FAD-dependent oxidoreductase
VSGRPLGPSIPNGGGILRPVLHRILSEATREAGVTVRLGVGVASLKQTEAEAIVELTDGTSAAYDFIVGADGAHSRLRAMLFPHAPIPAFTGQGCWRAVLPRPVGFDRAEVYLGGPIKAGLVPVSHGEMYLFLLQHVPENPCMPEEQWPVLLAEQLADFGGVLGAVREQLGVNTRINYRPLEMLMLPPPWYRGRAILIGDAAHATTPHLASGAGLAVEDALVLCELLQRDLPLQVALQTFMARRHERCRMIVENSVRLGEMEMLGVPAQEQAEPSRQSFEALSAPI